jgi:hypothetical protein
MARSIIGDTAAASGKPAPRRIRLPVPRKPADPILTPECPRAIVVERGDELFQIGLDDAHGRFPDRVFAQAVRPLPQWGRQ